jgi:hypothetical protein
MKRFTTYINESKRGNVTSLPTKKSTILFNDIKGSSMLWSDNEEEMFEALDKLEKLMGKLIKDHNGLIVKTIGDSYMCSYEEEDSLFDAIKMAINIQKSLNEDPIKVGDNEVKIRIGICYGDVYIKKSEIQGVELKDYFGNTVGSASRLESKVSDVDGFVFSFLSDIGDESEKEILDFLKDNDIDIEVIEYDKDCDRSKNRKRSGRLLTDLQISSCKDIEKLKGVKPLIAYKCKV